MNLTKRLKLPSCCCKVNWYRLILASGVSIVGINLTPPSTLAQTIPRINPPERQLPQAPQESPTPPPIQTSPSLPPSETPEQPQESISNARQPVCEINAPQQKPLTNQTNNSQQNSDSDTIFVKQFVVKGSTIFSCDELRKRLEDKNQGFFGRPLSFAELLQARSAITSMYTERKYTTTGAYIPKQQIDRDGAIITIQIVEGRVEEIRVRGTQRLNSNYVRSRLRLGASTPLNEDKLLDSIKLLQVNPLIDSISAELRAGVKPGTNVLEVSVKEANTWSSQIFLNNSRSPSIGSLRRGVSITQANLLGLGDSLSIGYNNTDGSNGYDLNYNLPLNAKNGTLNFSYGNTSANIIERPFKQLNIDSNSRYYQLTFRQPIIQTSTQEFSLSLTASRNESQTFRDGIVEPISRGADREGRTQVSALRFAQELVLQGRRQVIAARSQFSWGLDALDSTINNNGDPDSRFFNWRGQLYWIYLFGLNTGNLPTAPTFSIRTDFQLADRPLLSAEQVGFGGFGSVRGYRQDALLTDNGVLAAAEFRFPIVTIPDKAALLLIPFVDVGTGWNSGDAKQPATSTLASVGLGLQLATSGNFNARIDWGVPLINLDSSKKTWQENGIYFSLEYKPF